MAGRYNIYVILLDNRVRTEAKFRKANPGLGLKATCLYVGSSAQPPELRFEQHKRGYRASRFARKYGERLLPALYQAYNPIPSRRDAEELERYLAERLRSKGFGVWTN